MERNRQKFGVDACKNCGSFLCDFVTYEPELGLTCEERAEKLIKKFGKTWWKKIK
jgi:hypothetical protein